MVHYKNGPRMYRWIWKEKQSHNVYEVHAGDHRQSPLPNPIVSEHKRGMYGSRFDMERCGREMCLTHGVVARSIHGSLSGRLSLSIAEYISDKLNRIETDLGRRPKTKTRRVPKRREEIRVALSRGCGWRRLPPDVAEETFADESLGTK